MATLKPSTTRILKVYRQATDDQIGRGMSWYADAHSFARALDPTDPARAAGVIAALSPLTPWDRNMVLASRAYADGFASGTMGNSLRAADRILAGERPLDVLKGSKVRAFYKTIVDPTGTDAVAIDRHAFDIAVGRITDNDTRSALSRKGVYASFERAYVRAAAILGVAPSQVQAVTWVVHRETAIRCAAANRRAAETVV
jgi:hypothetical protein